MTFSNKVECFVLKSIRRSARLYASAHVTRALATLAAKGLIRRSGASWFAN